MFVASKSIININTQSISAVSLAEIYADAYGSYILSKYIEENKTNIDLQNILNAIIFTCICDKTKCRNTFDNIHPNNFYRLNLIIGNKKIYTTLMEKIAIENKLKYDSIGYDDINLSSDTKISKVEDIYYNKYLKYKHKYLSLKSLNKNKLS